MSLFCIKYSGLKFNHIFETKSFVFIPKSKIELADSGFFYPMEFFSCVYDKSSEFYVLLKESGEYEITLENFKEETFHKFKFLESVIALLFSNYIKREYIFILENSGLDYVVKNVFKCLSNKYPKVNRALLWKNSTFTNFLGEIVDKGFEKFDSISLKEDFATRFAFSIDMYLRGKFGEGDLSSNSDLWVSLEVLSVITISRILHSHDEFKVKKFYKKVKKIVKKHSSKVCSGDIDCWPPMKENFSDHMANKINAHLPILQKCLALVEEVNLEVEDIKVPLQKETDYDDPAEYQLYLDKIKEFKEYQDKLNIKKVLRAVYGNRNALFHKGKLSEDWSFETDRIKANFIKILEQLYFKILGLDMITHYQMGYPYQYIFGIPIKKGEFKNLGSLSNLEQLYVRKNYIEPLHTNYKNPFDYQPVIEKYMNWPNEFDSLRVVLASTMDKIIDYLNNSHPTQIVVKDQDLDYRLDYRVINKKKVMLTLRQDSGVIPIIYERIPRVVMKGQDNTGISSKFIGMFEDEIRYGADIVKVPFQFNPPYIFFSLN